MPTWIRYVLASLIGAIAIPAAAVTIVFGGMMLMLGLISAAMAFSGSSVFSNGAEEWVPAEVAVVLLGAGLLVGAIEVTRLLTRSSPRRRLYRSGFMTGLGASAVLLPVVGFAAYVSLHGSTEPGLPLPLILFAVLVHVAAGLVAWPIWFLRPELAERG